MRVGVLRVELLVLGACSLKDKRRVIKSLKDRIRNRFNASVAEVDGQDLWQRGSLGVAVVGTDGRSVGRTLDALVDFFRRQVKVEMVHHEVETY